MRTSERTATLVAAAVAGTPLDLDELDALDDAALRAELREAAVVRGRLDATVVALTGRLARRRAFQPDGVPDAATWLHHHGGLSKHAANLTVAVGRSAAELPTTLDSLRCGRIGLEHAAALARAQRAGVFATEPEDDLVARAEHTTPEDFRRHVDKLISAAGPPRPPGRRERTFIWDRDGMTHLHAALEHEHGAIVRSALEASADVLWRTTHPDRAPSRAEAVPSEHRLTDALIALCRDALADGPQPALADGAAPHDGAVPAPTPPSRRGTALPTMTVVIDYQTLRGELAATGRLCELLDRSGLDVATALRLACDCDIVPAVFDGPGAVLHYGRKTRLIPAALRSAVIARDRQCVGPRCSKPAAWCDVHHVIPWQHGGSTDIDNLALVCFHHHGLIHRYGWTLTGPPGRWTWTPPPDGGDPPARPGPRLHRPDRGKDRSRPPDPGDGDVPPTRSRRDPGPAPPTSSSGG